MPCGCGAPGISPRQIAGWCAIMGYVEIHIVAVRPGSPTMVDTVMAGVRVRAEWVGIPPHVGALVDVELDIEPVLTWADTIAIGDAGAMIRKGPRLRGTVEMQEDEILTVRIASGLLQVEVNDGRSSVPPGTAITLVAEHLKLYPTGI